MKSSNRAPLSLALALGTSLLASSLTLATPAWAQEQLAEVPKVEPAQAAPATPAPQAPAEPVFNLASPSLGSTSSRYRSNPDESTWASFLSAFQAYLSDSRVAKSPASAIIQKNPGLKDLGVQVFDASGMRVWSFPGISYSTKLILQSAYASAAPAATPADPAAVVKPQARVSTLEYPNSVNISDAQLVHSYTSVTKMVKVGKRKVVPKTVKVSGPQFLVVAGQDRTTSLIWLKAYKPYGGTWVATDSPFAKVPPYFLRDVSGKATFSGSNIVLSISAASKSEGGLPKPRSTSYQVVLKLAGEAYSLAEQPATDAPVSVISYFIKCLRQGQVELAKAWLKDTNLINIPKYAHVFEGGDGSPFKLIAMTTPPAGGPRFRLVTNKKHDLIFDLGKDKQRWIIRGIFIAPSDPLAKELSGTLVGIAVDRGQPSNIAAGEQQPAAAAKQPQTAPAQETANTGMLQ